jgi:hypothetical protein
MTLLHRSHLQISVADDSVADELQMTLLHRSHLQISPHQLTSLSPKQLPEDSKKHAHPLTSLGERVP